MSVRIPQTMTVIKRMECVLIPMGPTTVAVIWDTVVMESTALVSKLISDKGHKINGTVLNTVLAIVTTGI